MDVVQKQLNLMEKMLKLETEHEVLLRNVRYLKRKGDASHTQYKDNIQAIENEQKEVYLNMVEVAEENKEEVYYVYDKKMLNGYRYIMGNKDKVIVKDIELFEMDWSEVGAIVSENDNFSDHEGIFYLLDYIFPRLTHNELLEILENALNKDPSYALEKKFVIENLTDK